MTMSDISHSVEKNTKAAIANFTKQYKLTASRVKMLSVLTLKKV